MTPPDILAAAGVITLIALAGGGALGWLAQHTRNGGKGGKSAGAQTRLIDALNERLPQLQCGDCGYPGCRPYAEAIARDEVAINLCPPGGAQTAARLAEMLALPAPTMPPAPAAQIAIIDKDACIGCALCLPACPTDAIVGSPRHLHSVISEQCVGCGLCLPPCPVDCIRMVDVADVGDVVGNVVADSTSEKHAA